MGLYLRVMKMKKYGKINGIKDKMETKENNNDFQDEELKFILWKAELNKDLLSFWKSMAE
jgi:cysteinyl-tRNA synthetase